jgi:hypothetical protein
MTGIKTEIAHKDTLSAFEAKIYVELLTAEI